MAVRNTIYIAGPMRGYPRYNFDAFDAATERWRDWDWTVISPAEMDRNAGFNPDSEVEITRAMKRQFMRRDLVAIIDCHAIALLPGWEKSAGVKVETALAEFLGLEIYDAITGKLIDPGKTHNNVAEPTLKVGQVFGGCDPVVSARARELQAAGARFEFKNHSTGNEWRTPVINELAFTLQSNSYRMVSPPLKGSGTFTPELPDYNSAKVESAEEDRQKFSTGAVRSSDANGTRYDLISHIGLRRIAETYAEGAIKYDDNNWLKGFPASDVMNHCVKHIYQWLSGDGSEDHLAHAAWNLITVMHFEETRPELIDCYHRQERGEVSS